MLILEPGRAARNYWLDFWRYRELLYFLAWRDLAVRYKQTVVGVAWAVLRPALTMLVFIGFRRMVGVARGEVPDAILVLAGVLPWQFFSSALSEASSSLIGNANLISKTYFPRLIIPIASAVTSFVDFLVTLGMLALVFLWHRVVPGWQLIALPGLVLMMFVLALGLGLLFAALNVKYRDFRYLVPFMVQFGLFVSPVAFAASDVPPAWRGWLALNPLSGIIEGVRWSLLGGRAPLEPLMLGVSAAVTVASVIVGVGYFRRVERGFADLI